MTEQQRHLPSASTDIEPQAAMAVDLQLPLGELRVKWGTLCPRGSGRMGYTHTKKEFYFLKFGNVYYFFASFTKYPMDI